MTVWPIVVWPDPRLAAPSVPVGANGGTQNLATDLLDTLYASKGRGLAAPQIGVGRRIFVMDTTWKDGVRDPRVFIDPEVVTRSENSMAGVERCLSLPGIEAEVLRPDWVEVAWTDLDGTAQTDRFDGFAARCVQHEIDHLDGLVTLDHQSPADCTRLEAAFFAADSTA